MSIKSYITKKRLGLLIMVLVMLWTIYQTYDYIKNLPRAVTTFEGVTLGESKDQVFYAMGAPTVVLYEPKDPKSTNIFDQFSPIATKDQVDKTPLREKGFNQWEYLRKDKPRLDVNFNKKGEVELIGCYVSPKDWAYFDSCLVNGVQSLDMEDRIIEKLGKPDRESIDGVTKVMDFKKYNMRIYFEKKYAYYILVTNNFSK